MPAIIDGTSSRSRTWRVHASYPVGSTGWLAPRRTGSAAAKAAFVLGLLYAAVSVYWALGGTWLLATVGGALQRQGRTAILVLAVWAAVVIKMVAAVLPLLALRRVTSPGWNRAVSAAGVDRSRHPDRLRPGADRRRHAGPSRDHPPVGRCGSPGVRLARLPLGSLVPHLGPPRRGCPPARTTPPQPGESPPLSEAGGTTESPS